MIIKAIGDIHGKDKWKEVLNETLDHLVFVGDYFDAFDNAAPQQIRNFAEIVKLKETTPDKVTLCWGNHDIQYLPHTAHLNERYSGYQPIYLDLLRDFLKEVEHVGQVCWSYKDYLFSHAGITKTWLRNTMKATKLLTKHKPKDLNSTSLYINNLFKQEPKHFRYVVMVKGHLADPYGNDIEQGPFWVRPESLISDAVHANQVVGHTRMNSIHSRFLVPISKQHQVFFIDVLDAMPSPWHLTLSL